MFDIFVWVLILGFVLTWSIIAVGLWIYAFKHLAIDKTQATYSAVAALAMSWFALAGHGWLLG